MTFRRSSSIRSTGITIPKAPRLCIAAGTTNAPSLPATDLDGSPRILNGLVDMGCYEFTTNVFHPADLAGSWVITPSEFTAYAAAWKSGQTWTNAPKPHPGQLLDARRLSDDQRRRILQRWQRQTGKLEDQPINARNLELYQRFSRANT